MIKTQATALVPFLPSGPDFALALRFFETIGFARKWESGDCVGLGFGGASFILQKYDSKEWAENQMVVIEVKDLEGYWQELDALKLAENFAGTKIKPPTDFPWGREIHLIDPAGVCWHVRQAA